MTLLKAIHELTHDELIELIDDICMVLWYDEGYGDYDPNKEIDEDEIYNIRQALAEHGIHCPDTLKK